MRVVDGDTVNRVLTFRALVDAMEQAHRRSPMEIADVLLGDEQATFFVRSAVDAGRFVGSKLVTSTPANLVGGVLPAVQAVVVVFEATTGRPLAVIDGTVLTPWRTAADSALAASLLARIDARRLLIVGAGAMARLLARAHCAVRPGIDDIRIWNRTTDRAAEVAADLRAEGLPATVTTDLDEAVATSHLISTCTRSHTPLVRGQLLRPGTHVDLVGGYTPDHHEADDDTVARGRLFVDRRESAFDGVGDILTPIARGIITADDILGDLHDVVAGRSGRRSDDEITVFKNAGGGHLDLMTAEAILSALGIVGGDSVS